MTVHFRPEDRADQIHADLIHLGYHPLEAFAHDGQIHVIFSVMLIGLGNHWMRSISLPSLTASTRQFDRAMSDWMIATKQSIADGTPSEVVKSAISICGQEAVMKALSKTGLIIV